MSRLTLKQLLNTKGLPLANYFKLSEPDSPGISTPLRTKVEEDQIGPLWSFKKPNSENTGFAGLGKRVGLGEIELHPGPGNNPMRYKRLGRTGLKVSEVALGCMTFGEQANEKESQLIIDQALESGVNFFDTADVYTETRSETILGKGLKGRRHETVIATKVFGRVGEAQNDHGLSRKHIMDAVDNSLRRLQTDYIDIYQVHRWDPETPITETMETLNDLVRAGKVRYLGCSNFAAWQLCKALWVSDVHGLARFDSIQPRYNLLSRDIETELLPLCQAEGVGVIIYNPLAGGLLTGKHLQGNEPAPNTRFSLRRLYMDRYWSDENFDRVERFKVLIGTTGKSMVHVAVGWTLANPAVTSAIVGVSSVGQLTENLKAAEQPLTSGELEACSTLR